jgi:short-subunit dehydrogenase
MLSTVNPSTQASKQTEDMRPTAIITGASGGIGRAIAKQLDLAGYRLFLHGRNELALQALELELVGQHQLLVGDLNNDSASQSLLDKAFSQGHIDLLVNNAGISGFGELSQCTSDMINKQIQTNLVAPMLFTQGFVQRAQRKGSQRAKIINIGSAFGAIGFAGFSPYCASKFGLRGFTEALARELADSNISVGYFAPRATQTKINSDAVSQLNAKLGNAVDSPDDVAKAFMQFLHSNKSRKTLGWPEKFFVRLNGCLPELVDRALRKKLATIRSFSNKSLQESI